MNRIAIALTFCLAAPILGCGDDSASSDGGLPDLSATQDLANGFPAAPTLGMQIDRMGRPAINTALTDPFDTQGATRTPDVVKDEYNSEANPAMWASKFAAEMAGNLAILDGADTVCGNSIGQMGGNDAGNRYGFTAGLLADDELYVNTANGSCALYLAVEASALGVAAAATQCGGRTPTIDTIDPSYTVLISGVGALLAGNVITDGIDTDSDGNANSTTFPFLGAPN